MEMLCHIHVFLSGTSDSKRAVKILKMMQKSGRSSTSRADTNVECVGQIICSDCQLTIRIIADGLNINQDFVQKIITKDLLMKKICAKVVPKLLTID